MSENFTIKPLSDHYAFQNIPTIFDQEALTVLELVARMATKINEIIKVQNDMGHDVDGTLKEQTEALEKAIKDQEDYLRAHIANAKHLFSDATVIETADIMEPGDYITQAGKVINLPADAEKESGFLSVRVSETEAMKYWVKQTWMSNVTGATYSRIYSRSTQIWTPWEPISSRICKVFQGSVNDLLETGLFICDGVTDAPYHRTANGVCMVRSVYNPNDRTGGRNNWVEQVYYSTAYPSRYAKRFKTGNTWGEWIYSGGGELLEDNASLDNLKTEGCFTVPPALVPDIVGRFKENGQYYALLTVRRFDALGENFWVSHELTVMPQYYNAENRYSPFRLYRSFYSNSGKWTDWSDGSQTIAITDPTVENADTLFRCNGHYWFPTASPANKTPADVTGVLDVEVYSYPTTPTQLVKQTFTKYSTSSVQTLKQWVRMGSFNRAEDTIAWRPWLEVGSPSSSVSGDSSGSIVGGSGESCNCYNPDLGTIVVLGDSVPGNYVGADSVCGGIAERTRAHVVNCAFGGTRYDNKVLPAEWAYFSFARLTPSIRSGDYTNQETSLATLIQTNQLTAEVAERFQENLSALKAVDFNKVSTIVLMYGGNDWANGDTFGTPDSTDVQSGSVASSLRYGIDQILGKYKHIRIVVCSPTPRFSITTHSTGTGVGDVSAVNGLTLQAFCEKLEATAKYAKMPFVDLHNIGIMRSNCLHHFSGNDGVHPVPATQRMIGRRIGSFIVNM